MPQIQFMVLYKQAKDVLQVNHAINVTRARVHEGTSNVVADKAAHVAVLPMPHFKTSVGFFLKKNSGRAFIHKLSKPVFVLMRVRNLKRKLRLWANLKIEGV